MADFCQACSINIFGEDNRELANLLEESEYSDSIGAGALCECCGYVVVDINGKAMNPLQQDEEYCKCPER